MGVSGLSTGQNIGDLTIRQRIYVDVHEIVAKKKTSQPFKLNHYYPKSPSSLKKRKFKLKLTKERGPRTSSDRDRASLSPCRFSSQVNLEFLISRRSFAKNSRAELLFCLLSKEPY